MRLFGLFLVVMVSSIGSVVFAQQSTTIPNFWDPQERFIKPNVKALPRLRFLTTTDFPPFSFIDKDNRLTGFHVDLARAICRELEVLSVCQIQAVPYDTLEKELIDGRGDAIMAGLAASAEMRRKFAFSRPYFQLPARFVVKNGSGLREPLSKQLAGKEVGIVDGTAHAAMAMANFGDIRLRLFDTQDAALASLQKDEIAAVFADGLTLSFWLQAQNTKGNCCEFAGQAYLSADYFGSGLAIALPRSNRELAEALNFALRSVNDKGTFAELYLRYFPISLF